MHFGGRVLSNQGQGSLDDLPARFDHDLSHECIARNACFGKVDLPSVLERLGAGFVENVIVIPDLGHDREPAELDPKRSLDGPPKRRFVYLLDIHDVAQETREIPKIAEEGEHLRERTRDDDTVFDLNTRGHGPSSRSQSPRFAASLLMRPTSFASI